VSDADRLARPAFYALRGGGWRDLVTVLHPPYTAWNLANVGFGAAGMFDHVVDTLFEDQKDFATQVGAHLDVFVFR